MRRMIGVLVMTGALLGCAAEEPPVAIEQALPTAPTTTTDAATTTAAPTTTTTAAPTTTTTAPPPTTTTAAPPTTVALARAAPASSCHPSYDPCLPITGDLDCAEVGHTVRVIGVDDYRLDGDGDGFGCD
jgi:hypothetical protein